MHTFRRVFLFVAALALLVFWAKQSPAYYRYDDGCQSCHGAFTDGTSPKGSVFPGNNKHEMHRSTSYMNTNCWLCHKSDDGWNPFIGISNGTNDNPGIGCLGCHEGPGLRAHHVANQVTSCGACHTQDPPPEPENVQPVYYGTVDTYADNSCNPDAVSNTNENWTIGDFVGLDNDGDNLYDGSDPDCNIMNPIADVKVNGSDGPINITGSNTLSVTASLDAGGLVGENADWWMLASTPFGFFHYDIPSDSWLLDIVVTHQGPLFSMGPHEVLNMSGLPQGTYTFYFGVDMVLNGNIDMGSLYYDSAEVNVTQ